MPYCVTGGITITGIASAVPQNKVTIDSYIETFGKTDVEKFKKYTGIHEVRRAIPEQTAGDLGFAAADRLLNKLDVPREEIGVLVFISQSPDYIKPATACVLQYRLGLGHSCMAFDVNQGCSGFIYGDQLLRSILKSSESEYGLLIVADTASKHADQSDKSMAMLNGDAGTATLYKKGGNEKCITLIETDGSGYRSLILPAGGFRDPEPDELYFLDADGNKHSKLHSYMDGMGIFNFSIGNVPKAVKEYLLRLNKTVDDYSYVILHQANFMIMKQIARRLSIPLEKMPVSLDRFGNCNGATVPLTICDAFAGKDMGRLNLLVAGFGIGLSLGVTSFTLDPNVVLPIFETNECFIEGRF